MPTPTTAQLLNFEAAHPDIRGEVDGLIRRELGITPARYCQLLMRAAVSLEGQAYDPITAHREIRRMRRVASQG